MKSRLLGAVCYCATGLTWFSNAYAVSYTITDLGAFSGNFSLSEGLSINSSRQITGFSYQSNEQRAFLWANGVMQDLGTLGGNSSVGGGVNDIGQVVGTSKTTGSHNHAFLWQDGVMQDLGTLGGSSSGVSLSGINASGQVVGESDISGDAASHAFLWDNGDMQDLGTLGGPDSAALGINASGQVAGVSRINSITDERHAFLWDNGTMQDLGTLGGGGPNGSIGRDINDNGQLVGDSRTTGNAELHAFLWDSVNGMQDLGTLGGAFSSASAINNRGQVVGQSATSNSRVAFLYSDGEMLDLCVLVNCVGAGWTMLNFARDINENGDITGLGTINGEQHGFLISVVPIPPALYLFGGGLVGLVGMAKRKAA